MLWLLLVIPQSQNVIVLACQLAFEVWTLILADRSVLMLMLEFPESHLACLPIGDWTLIFADWWVDLCGTTFSSQKSRFLDCCRFLQISSDFFRFPQICFRKSFWVVLKLFEKRNLNFVTLELDSWSLSELSNFVWSVIRVIFLWMLSAWPVLAIRSYEIQKVFESFRKLQKAWQNSESFRKFQTIQKLSDNSETYRKFQKVVACVRSFSCAWVFPAGRLKECERWELSCSKHVRAPAIVPKISAGKMVGMCKVSVHADRGLQPDNVPCSWKDW